MIRTIAAGAAGAVALAGLAAVAAVAADDGTGTGELRPVPEFAGIEDEAARSAALFDEMAKVIEHPRCMNCHPRDDSPRQGDGIAMHEPPVVRGGEGGMGVPGMQCTTCHGPENVAFVGAEGAIPGHEVWHLPPVSMGWIGLSTPEICARIKDPGRNGGRDLAAILEHHAEDGLVGWAWHPGKGRAPAPGSQQAFGALTEAWIETGAHCPSG